MNASEGDVAFACASVFVDELVRGGLRHAAVSPGSRSAPMALALARHPGVTVHVHLDERAAAFFALGVARASGAPAAAVCTSGTATANYFPAVVEASMDHVPLLLLTADRPPELHGVGANQTIDQQELYGGFVRAFINAGVPEAGPDSGSGWRSLAVDVLTAALGLTPGPVQVNLPFRDPLVPTGDDVDLGPGKDGRPEGGPWKVVEQEPIGPADGHVASLADAINSTERGLVVAGNVPGGQSPPGIADLATAAGWPLLAEPTSGLRRPGALAAGTLLAGDATVLASYRPEVVVRFGASPTSRAVQGLVAPADRSLVVTTAGRPADPSGGAEIILADPTDLIAGALPLIRPRTESGWRDEWRAMDASASAASGGAIDGLESISEARVARDLAAWLPDGSVLAAGSSMPIRDLDLFMAPREGLRVLGNRGASGIDGFVSTAFGIAAAGAPTYALLGDLTLLHDAGSLLWSGGRGPGVCFVVVNNSGGGIFSFLPQAGLAEHEALFATPHGIDLGALAAAAGVRHAVIERPDGLPDALRAHPPEEGVSLLEVRTDRDRNVAEHRQIAEAVALALR
jgi:2-succinyl-5-enolpyruvyl-6-hydroxy-3-cyclohexene-1-carboxylate synthase